MTASPVRLAPGARFPEAARVLECFAHGPRTSSEIARKIGLPADRVWRCLCRLSEQGQVAIVLDDRGRQRWDLVARMVEP